MKFFVIGSLNMDLVIQSPVAPENGMTVAGEGFMMNSGGKGANQATAIAKLGGDVRMVGCVGKVFGEELKNTLSSYGVNVDLVETKTDVSSGIAVIIVTNGDNRIILDKGANTKVTPDIIDYALSFAEEGDYLVLQLEIPIESVCYALQAAKAKKMITVLNPAPAATLLDGGIANCDFFIVNQSEAKFYTDMYPTDAQSARQCAAILQSQGAKNILITLGEQGSVCACKDGFYSVSACKVDAVDTTAAGDTYVGAFVTYLSEGKSIEEAMAFASKAAAITVTRRGAQQSIPYRTEI